MLVNLIIFTLIIGAIYVFTSPDNRVAATTSALGQIWSGSCRLGCRPSAFSGCSGLSALQPPGVSRDSKGLVVARASQDPRDCQCASCPCAHIENFLRTCRPATTMYSNVINMIASAYYYVIEMLSDMYNYVERILSCRASCQRPQLVETTDSASETIYFVDKRGDIVERGKEQANRSKSNSKELRTSRSIIFKDVPDTKGSKQGSKNVPDPMTSGVSDVTLKPKKEDDEKTLKMSAASNTCPRCAEEGKVCMKNCPKAAKKKK